MADYPAWRYHANQPARLIETVEEDMKLGSDWYNNPKLDQAPGYMPRSYKDPSPVPAPLPEHAKEEVKPKPVVTSKGKGK